jgi:predicted P-loop ATPase
LIQHALSYALRGWYVHPLRPNSKKPASKEGLKDATIDAATITNWWKQNPRFNIGVNLKASGFAVIDVDNHSGEARGFSTLAELEAKYGELPETLTVTTPRGGEHRYFRVRDGVTLPGSLGLEVDLKHNGYCVLPPSRLDEVEVVKNGEGAETKVHLKGDYEWIDEAVPIAELPEWVYTFKADTRKIHAAAGAGVQEYVKLNENGKRTDGRKRAATSLAGTLRRKGFDSETIAIVLKQDNEKNNEVLLDDAFLEDQARGILRYEPDTDAHYLNTAWKDLLLRTERGAVKKLLANALIAFRQAPEWQGVLRCDAFALQIHAVKTTPWGYRGVWDDHQDRLATEWLQVNGVPCDNAHDAVKTVAIENGFHPVRDYLNELKWDGKPRIDRFLCDYLGAPEMGRYTECIGRYWLISAVARIFQPGCQADHTLVLEGPQGKRKSSALRALFEPWFTDDFSDIGTKDSKQEIQGKWAIELSELDSLNRRDAVTVKAFLTRRVDRYRAPYDRFVKEHPRQCVFSASTNEGEYLKDQTGGRRFWPVKTALAKPIDINGIVRDKDQIWAEAVHLYRKGERWWIEAEDVELLSAAEDEQAQRSQRDPWEGKVADYIQRERRTHYLMAELLTYAVEKSSERQTTADTQRLGAILRTLGYEGARTQDKKRRYWRLRGSPDIDSAAFDALEDRTTGY